MTFGLPSGAILSAAIARMKGAGKTKDTPSQATFASLRNFRRLGRVTALSRKGLRPSCRPWVSGAAARKCLLPALATDQAALAA